MRRLGRLITAGVLLFGAGCSLLPLQQAELAPAAIPFQQTELMPTTPKSAAELTQGLWSFGEKSVLVAHSALFEMRGMKVPVTAMMRLDPRAREARLVGMNDMGVKLYDITVAAGSTRVNFVIPELERYPGFAEAAAVSVRRIFLDPLPEPGDRLETGKESYLLTRENGSGATLRFLIGGAESQLLEKSSRGEGESWLVRYYQYRPGPAGPFPEGIVLEDERAGYRLTLWIDNVGTSDE